ncbi:phosphatidylserine/phosphatidylglycerophosphate/cardiolipin synthase-like enzyme [Salsuginibacillus halophilus]|uniref:Phosphatidylserine/phosphatidylglycerophosphate/ cardiolipin synthase-like enzyme n=1 Tax=Salsuginibacillus halophilus TaxID=517424 RepID=A0A2P8H880_9BACI|nr:phospholipase D-like domain-containing protein [Salsuginibacillus halophilus]PSL42404.1 phosphatidylserine/phosphatidylglycerophosphate/cardiolipin synthase-like enzyme [Salsuginibacillus halophilus]
MIRRYPVRSALILIFSVLIIVTLYGMFKPLPEGVSYEGEVHSVDDVDFIYNRSSMDEDGNEDFEEEIFTRILEAVSEAEEFVLVDLFLYNDKGAEDEPPISGALTEALIEKHEENEDIDIIVLTDPINTSYHSHESTQLQRLEEAGIETVITELDPLRDSNPLYSGIWRTFLQWFGQEGEGWIENPFGDDAPDMTVRSYLKLMNGKANHRKVIATEQRGFVTSANWEDAGAYYSNAGFEIQGEAINDLVSSAQAVLDFSGGPDIQEDMQAEPADEGPYDLQVLTEGENFEQAKEMLQGAEEGDDLWLGMFFLSERNLIDEIENAAERGVNVRLILDPNENAFGVEVFGMPNRPVAEELLEDSEGAVNIRWYNTADEQFHPKMLAVFSDDKAKMLAGSANFSSRNLRNNNLDTNVYIESDVDAEAAVEVREWFEEMWLNDGQKYTLAYGAYENPHRWWKRLAYGLQKISGLTTY